MHRPAARLLATIATVTAALAILTPSAGAAQDHVRTTGIDPASFAATPAAAQALIDSTAWLTDPKGPRLAVFPTDYGRYDAPNSARLAAWNEVIALVPSVNRNNMKNQFLCHFDFARVSDPDKASWNLEQWRPDVSYTATVLAGCNPT